MGQESRTTALVNLREYPSKAPIPLCVGYICEFVDQILEHLMPMLHTVVFLSLPSAPVVPPVFVLVLLEPYLNLSKMLLIL